MPVRAFLSGSSSGEAAVIATDVPEPGGALYQCPMHIDVVQDEPGDCPICRMKLIEVAGFAAASAGESSAPNPGEREVLYWYAPMDPTYMRDEPGAQHVPDQRRIPTHW